VNAPFATEPEAFGEIDPFLMANLYPEDTGLPMTVWIGPRGGARHDVRVKVNMTHGARMEPTHLATVSVRPQPELLHGRLSSEDFDAVRRWIVLNEDVIVDYWDGALSTGAMIRRLKTV
jgi:hypothetical protein